VRERETSIDVPVPIAVASARCVVVGGVGEGGGDRLGARSVRAGWSPPCFES